MRRFVALFGALVLACHLLGCGDSAPAPPSSGDSRDNWPDEVKKAEDAMFKKATEKGKGG